MRFRPCIDIHNGKVKQIIGGSLLDKGDFAKENFVSEQDGGYYAGLYKNYGLEGGHIILLNPPESEYYEADVIQAKKALKAYPGGMMIGGGINIKNAAEFLNAGASHVIVTSYVFKDGQINYENLEKLYSLTTRECLVLDISCRKKGDSYYIVTDRWQKFTNVKVNEETISKLSAFCDEFLVHAVDVEGKSNGIEEELIKLLAKCRQRPITYAGGVGSYDDLIKLKKLGNDTIDVTVGSALDLFGGPLSFEEVLNICARP